MMGSKARLYLQQQWRLAESHASKNEWAQARECYLRVLQVLPGHAECLLQLSYIESLTGHYRQARSFALRAYDAAPTRSDVVGELAARLRTFNEIERLFLCIDRMLQAGADVPLLIDFSAKLSNLNEQERALRLLDIAKRKNELDPTLLLLRGQVLTYLGCFDEAEIELEAALAQSPELGQAHLFLSRMHKKATAHFHVARIREQLSRKPRYAEQVIPLAYALHKELDDLGDVPGAWQALEQACHAKRALLRYDPEDSRTLIDKLIAWSSATATPVVETDIQATRTPIFIVGMHRSGTTLLEQLLDGHEQIHGVGELYDFTSQMRYATDHHCRGVIDATIVERAGAVDYAAVGAGYLKGMQWRLGCERFFTDKLPSNFLNIGFICRALPQAKILHMVRDPMETCFSNLRELFSDANPYSYDQAELGDFHKQYRRLMAHWHATFPGRILDVDYAALTRDPETVLRDVTAFCGLDFQPKMLDLQQRKRGVATASAVQVRDRIVTREQPKWAPYAEHLEPLRKALEIRA